MADIDVNKLIQDNLAAFYGYAYERLYDKDKATDLAHEIVVEIQYRASSAYEPNGFYAELDLFCAVLYNRVINFKDVIICRHR